jgi:hypothetical protein
LKIEQANSRRTQTDFEDETARLLPIVSELVSPNTRHSEIVAMFEHPKITALARMLRGEDMGTGRVAAAQARAKQQGDALKRLRAARVKS